MKVEKTDISDLLIIKNNVYHDERGYFVEDYHKKIFADNGIMIDFVQDNRSFSKFGVLRGLHFQKGSFAQAKLIRVVAGKIFDIAVDLRKNSATFGKSFSIELSEENGLSFLIPRGFAHGFVTLSNSAVICYKCDNYYNKESDSGVIYNDKDLAIKWPLPESQMIISSKDLQLPILKDAEYF